MNDRTQVNLRLPTDLIDQIDQRRGPLNISRNQWIENMARWALANTYTTQEGIQMAAEKAEQDAV